MPKILQFLSKLFIASFVIFFSTFQAWAAEGDILFFDDFNDGNLDGWTIESGDWFVNNGNLAGSKSGRAFGGRINTGNSEWDNYSIELDVNNQQGIDEGIGFRYTPGGDSYELNLRHGAGSFNTPEAILRKNQDGVVTVVGDTRSFPLLNQKWYHLKIDVQNENIKIWIDNNLIFDITDTGTKVKKGILTLSYWTGDVGVVYVRFDNIQITALAPPPSPKTPLILIPGIGGSELKVEEDTIWNKDDGHGGIYNKAYTKDEVVWMNEPEARAAGEDDYFDILRMKTDGVNPEANLSLTNNLLARAYQNAIDFFIFNGYTLNQDFFVFPYDWRKDIALTASSLDTKINQIKSQTGSAKVDVVAHSMGGLVARNYIADATRAQNVRKLFTLGTPHLGAPQFLKAIRDGICLKYPVGDYCLSLAPSELKDVLQNMISGFELAPTQTYFTFFTGENSKYPYPYRTELGALNYLQIKDYLTSKGHQTSLFTPSEQFHNLDTSLVNTNGVDVNIIVGSGRPTIGQIIEVKTISLLGIEGIKRDIVSINGDETVPLYSASLNDPSRNISLLGAAKVFYTNQEHSNLVSSGPALELIKNSLNSNSELPSGVSTTPFPVNNGLLFSAHSPVNIHVYDSNGNHTGPTPNGDSETNIPSSSYDTLGDAKFIYLPDDGIYNIKFEATDNGSFDFKIRKFKDDQNTETILYKEIPLTDNTKAETVFDTNSSETPTIKVDQDGDGDTDLNVEKFSTLEGEANYDYTPPTISFDVSPKTIWPPNNKMVDVNITGTITDENPYLTTIVVDDEYDLVEPSVTIENQTSINQIIKLEASRKGEDNDGRKYIIKILATDLAGNTSLATTEVIVPHDQGKKK